MNDRYNTLTQVQASLAKPSSMSRSIPSFTPPSRTGTSVEAATPCMTAIMFRASLKPGSSASPYILGVAGINWDCTVLSNKKNYSVCQTLRLTLDLLKAQSWPHLIIIGLLNLQVVKLLWSHNMLAWAMAQQLCISYTAVLYDPYIYQHTSAWNLHYHT